MSRTIHADTIAELAKDSFNMAHLIKIDFEIPLYLTESPYDITHGGVTYSPSSSLQGMSTVTETSEVQVGSISITLSGVSQEYIAILIQ